MSYVDIVLDQYPGDKCTLLLRNQAGHKGCKMNDKDFKHNFVEEIT